MTGDNSVQSNWNATDEGSVVYLQTQLSAPTPFEEVNDRPKDGAAYLAMLQECINCPRRRAVIDDSENSEGVSPGKSGYQVLCEDYLQMGRA